MPQVVQNFDDIEQRAAQQSNPLPAATVDAPSTSCKVVVVISYHDRHGDERGDDACEIAGCGGGSKTAESDGSEISAGGTAGNGPRRRPPRHLTLILVRYVVVWCDVMWCLMTFNHGVLW